MACMGDYVLDDPIGLAPTSEIWNDSDGAACDQSVADIAPEVPVARIRHKFLPYSLNNRRLWQRLIRLVQVLVQSKQFIQLVRVNQPDVHRASGLTPKVSGAGAEGGGCQHWP